MAVVVIGRAKYRLSLNRKMDDPSIALTENPALKASMAMYRTIYDVRDQGYGVFPFVWLLLVCFVVFEYVGLIRCLRAGRWGTALWALVPLSILTGAVYAGVSGPIYNRWKCMNWASRGDYKVVEGTVEQFIPQPREGHVYESFSVDGVSFLYSSFNLTTGGYRRSAAYGGVIKEGLRLRVSYHEVSPADRRILILQTVR